MHNYFIFYKFPVLRIGLDVVSRRKSGTPMAYRPQLWIRLLQELEVGKG